MNESLKAIWIAVLGCVCLERLFNEAGVNRAETLFWMESGGSGPGGKNSFLCASSHVFPLCLQQSAHWDCLIVIKIYGNLHIMQRFLPIKAEKVAPKNYSFHLTLSYPTPLSIITIAQQRPLQTPFYGPSCKSHSIIFNIGEGFEIHSYKFDFLEPFDFQQLEVAWKFIAIVYHGKLI